MTNEVLCGDQGPFEGPFESFSLKRCYLKTPTDTYLLHALFPRLARTIRRRKSEERGVIGCVPAVRVDFSGAEAVDGRVPIVQEVVVNEPLAERPPSGAAPGQLTVRELREVIEIGTEMFGIGSATPIDAEGNDEGRNTGGDRGANRIEEDAPASPE